MQTKNLIKIIKAEATVLVSLIENLPDDGNVQSYEVDLLINKIQALNNIAVHLSSDNADVESDNASAIAAEEAARKAAEEEEARLFAEAEAAKRAEELEAERKAAEELARKKAEEEEAARKAAAEEEARKIAAAEAAKRAEELEKVRQIAIEEAERKAAAAEEARKAAEEAARKAEEETRKAQSLADMFADNTADVEQTYTVENEQQDEVSAPAEPKAETKPSTLADRFQQNTPSVNDVLAGLEKKANLASRFNSRPITNLRKAIKINDRIRFVNELFERDSIQYEQTIDMIEQSANINEALSNIFSNHNWNQEDETTVDFLELVYQRFKAQ